MSQKKALYENVHNGKDGIWIGTPILTPVGFKMLSEINVGDYVYGPDGLSHIVLSVSELKKNDAYRCVFDDDSEIVCNVEQLWFTYTASDLEKLTKRTDEYRAKRRATRVHRVGGNRTATQSAAIAKRNFEYAKCSNEPIGTVKTMEEIVSTLRTNRGRTNHAIPLTKPIQFPEKVLPLDPYLMGLWLGDGASVGDRITSADGLEKCFSDAGFTVRQYSKYDYGINGLVTILRGMNLLNNKHIPDQYLWASYEQRLALLQGLMDTDGNCLKNGSAEFTGTNSSLVSQTAQLVRSLGMKCSMREGNAKLNGMIIGKKYRIKFVSNLPVFRMERKLERQNPNPRRTTRLRYLVQIEKLQSIEMKSISIDSQDHLYLIGEHFITAHD